MASIKDIIIYPVKGMAGISLKSAHCTHRGLQYDRRYMLIDSEGRFLSQRKTPQMAKFRTNIGNGTLSLTYEGDVFELSYGNHTHRLITNKIWSHTFDAYHVSDDADQWLSARMNTDCRLVFMADDIIRTKSLIKAPRKTILSYADGYPYLVLGTGSMDYLNQKLDTPISIDRFRANIIISTGLPHIEDEWDYFSIGKVPFRMIKSCARCIVTTIDQQTAQTGKEPLSTLSSYRKIGNKILFGMNAVLRQEGVIYINDTIALPQK